MKKLHYLLGTLLLTAALVACSSSDLYDNPPEQPDSHQMDEKGENDTTDYTKEMILPVEANADVKDFFQNALKMVEGENDFFYDDEKLHGAECFGKCLVINNRKAFEQLYRGKEELPEIDFNKASVIIGLQRFEQDSYEIQRFELVSSKEKLHVNLYAQLGRTFNPFNYSNRCYWGLFPKIEENSIPVNIIKESDVQQYTTLPFYDSQVPVELKEQKDLPKWLVNSIKYYEGDVKRAPYVKVCQGVYDGESLFLMYNPLNSCMFCDLYDSKGKALDLSENELNSVSNWTLIYLVLNFVVY